MKKFILLGADSRLAQAFIKAYPDECIALSKKDCDITNQRQIEQILKNYACSYVLNCAAITDIDYCEKHPEKCFETNTIAVSSLNELCLRYNKKLIHISSDYAVNPVNVYGYSKFMSEKLIDKTMLVVRTNFYDSQTYIIKNLLTNEKVDAYANIFLNPISLTQLVKEIYAHKNKKGLVNLFSQKKLSWYQFAGLAANALGKDNKLIIIKTFANEITKAPRPLSSYVQPDIKIDIQKDLVNFSKKHE